MRDLELLLCFFYKQSRTSESQKLAKWSLSLLVQSVKQLSRSPPIKWIPIWCIWMQSFRKKKCVWLMLIIMNTLKWWFFNFALTQERIGTFLWGVQPAWYLLASYFSLCALEQIRHFLTIHLYLDLYLFYSWAYNSHDVRA